MLIALWISVGVLVLAFIILASWTVKVTEEWNATKKTLDIVCYSNESKGETLKTVYAERDKARDKVNELRAELNASRSELAKIRDGMRVAMVKIADSGLFPMQGERMVVEFPAKEKQ